MRKTTYGLSAILLVLIVSIALYQFAQPIQPVFSKIETFKSYEELNDFLKTSMEQAKYYQRQYPTIFFRESEIGLFDTASALKSVPEYSTTNIQVAGVDEADIVKTDGEHLYIVSGDTIYIARVYPSENAEVLSRIDLNGTYGSEIYIIGDKLVVLGNNNQIFYLLDARSEVEPAIVPHSSESFIKVYDITDRTSPIQTRILQFNGTFTGSRMIDEYLYTIVKQPSIIPINETEIEVSLPKIQVGDVVYKIEATEVRYPNVPDMYYDFTTIVSVNVLMDSEEPKYETFLSGYSSSIYVALKNMYLTVPDNNRMAENQETLIYRIKLDEGQITLEAEGSVPGFVLNQFSMDEYNDVFRIATTKWGGDFSKNNIFTLDMNLEVIGTLEGLASGEQIYSARFMGDRCYLVTFRQIDPFFVIDLSDPTEPEVLGYLKIPGFSGYLHPYDQNNIIGIGKQDSNVKLSLFNVENVSDPKETAKYIFDGSWSDTPVLWNHKAFLFEKSKNLLAFPLSIDWIRDGDKFLRNFWQGAVIFEISLEDGFTLRDGITHQENNNEIHEGDLEVMRIFYIDNVLYTISNSKVKMNDMESLEHLNEIELS